MENRQLLLTLIMFVGQTHFNKHLQEFNEAPKCKKVLSSPVTKLHHIFLLPLFI